MKGGLRGLTAVPGGNGQILLGAPEEDGVIEAIDPVNGHTVSVEFDFKTYFRRLWSGLGGAASLAAYSDMTPWFPGHP